MIKSNSSSPDRVEELIYALELFTAQAVFDPHTHRVSVDEFVLSKAREALARIGRSV